MKFGIHFDPFKREFWGLWSDKPFVIKQQDERFWGYNSLPEAALARKPEDEVFQFKNGGWHRILFIRNQILDFFQALTVV